MGIAEQITRKLTKEVAPGITCTLQNDRLLLEGELDDWDLIVKAGKLAAKYHRKKHNPYLGIVNDIHFKNFTPSPMTLPIVSNKDYDGATPDVAIIGGGIIGCAIARTLSKWNLDIMLLEKEYDVAIHASSRNDGMVHPGIDLHKGSEKVYYNSRGNRMYESLAAELDVPFERRGSYILFDKAWQRLTVPVFLKRAKENDIPGICYVNAKTIHEKEPSTANWVKGGIFLPSSSVVSPYQMTVALAENAVTNGIKLCLNTAVINIIHNQNQIKALVTNRGIIYPKIVINAGGAFADVIAQMANDQFFTIHPRKGTIAILDKKANYLTHTVIAKAPFSDVKKNTKGGGIVRTIDNNILVGPDAHETPLREDFSTTREDLNSIFDKHVQVAPKLSKSDIITYFSGTRAPTYEEDFIVKPSPHIDNLIYAAGIQSPGVTAAPAIAVAIEKFTLEKLTKIKQVSPNEQYSPLRKGIPRPSEMTDNERNALIKENPDYGKIICRCEEISRGEILDAIHAPIPALSLDAIKRRVRPGMGRCQGGFCSPIITQIIHEETGIPLTEIVKGTANSTLITGMSKPYLTKGGDSK